MIRALDVANSILNKAFNENISITPMKLQKLIYILYKDYLKKTGKSLFNEDFQAWQYGPVLSSVYDQFKKYGGNNIKDYYCTFENGQEVYTLIDERRSEEFSNSLDSVWNNYKRYHASYLSELTHASGGAWQRAVDNKTYILDNEDIKNEEDYL